MQIRTFAVGAAILCALVVHHAWSRGPADAPRLRPVRVARAAAINAALPARHARPSRPATLPDGLATLAAELEWATAVDVERIADLEDTLDAHGMIEGRIFDVTSGEPLAGVTISVSSPGGTPQWAVTDERGGYQISDLAPGRYSSTLYYDRVVVHDELDVVARRVTQHDGELDPDSRTFEGVLAVTVDHETDVAFGCGTSLDNVYYVGDLDVTGVTFSDADDPDEADDGTDP